VDRSNVGTVRLDDGVESIESDIDAKYPGDHLADSLRGY
jgi:hypothetical protein